MPMTLIGLHHVTATVDDAQDDLDFCLDGLGLRLVKKTVNFDNHHVYHFYYGDERGTPGTIWTTFPYKDRGVPVGVKGAGQVTVTSFSVPNGSLDFWRARLGKRGIAVTDLASRFGEPVIRFADRSGLTFELIASGARRTNAVARRGRRSRHVAIRGLHSVTMVVRDAAPTLELMTGLLGYTVVDEAEQPHPAGGRTAADRAGRSTSRSTPDADAARNGIGTVHHVAMAIGSADEQLRLREELIRYGLQGHRGARSLLLPVDLLPRAGRRAVRGGDDRAGLHGRRGARRRSDGS